MKIDDYKILHGELALLATVLNTDYIKTAAFENYYTGSTLDYSLAQAAGCDLQRHRLDDELLFRAYYFGYFHKKGDVDKYKISIPSGKQIDIKVAGTENTILTLKQTNGKVVRRKEGDNTLHFMKSDATGDYILEVESNKCAGPYHIVIDYDTLINGPGIKPLKPLP